MRSAAQALAVIAATLSAAAENHVCAADAAFDKFLQSLIPQAQSLGVTRATFAAATRGLTPDLSLPDLVIPGRVTKPPGQPEFVLTPGDYLKDSRLVGLAAYGRGLAARHRTTLARIAHEIGVPGNVVLAIWGRETDFARYRLPHDAIRALATQAYLGRRKDIFREEFLLALRILQEGHVKRADMRSSWAGALGLTQFLPSDFYRYAVDFDGDGHLDIWTSVPDALASAARQLVGKGWQRGGTWAIEVKTPKDFDCARAEPSVKRPVAEWLRLGFVPAGGRKLSAQELAEDASVLMPEGTHGPAFLTPKNYFVIKDYNFSDLYVLFVGTLADRIAGGRGFVTPWAKDAQLRTAQVEAMQRQLTALGLYKDKIDGKAGMLTRAALGAYQQANGLALDCWPTAAVLRHMTRR
ncbi:MAG: lytic murein transglycosylase [Rhizobiales bacterium]|nr:lytic murein transglycosylase [Hyphomicrobiales bacterium]